LGNYLGALREWVRLQETANHDDVFFYSIVDLHALTIPPDRDSLLRRRKEALATLLAIGLDPKKSNIFIQSAVCSRHGSGADYGAGLIHVLEIGS
jgi:tryptophanyl-tRNA synthetase